MLKLRNINVTFGKNTAMPMQVLKDLDLSVADGEFVILVGNNGCGKSTLLNTIAGHIQPDTGTVEIANLDVTAQTATQRSNLVALVMQDPRVGTLENMTLEENLNLAYMRGKTRKLLLHNRAHRRNLFKEYLAMLGMHLENRLDDLVGTLSGGQRQALSLIMAIMAEHKILLLDEITAALDPNTANTVMEIAARLVHEQKRTTILITHNMQYALHYGDRTILMARDNKFCEYAGSMRQDLSPAALAAGIGTY